MNAPDALPGYEALLPPDTTFRNEVAARVAPTIATYRPGRAAKKIKFPILFCVSDTDSVTPPAQTLRYARTAPLKVLPSIARDFTSFFLRKPPTMIPLAGPPGSLALMNAPDALPGYEALLPPETTFRNEVAARVAPTIATYRPGRVAKKIKFPILFCVSDIDSVTPPAQTLRYARTAPRGEIKRYDAGHFDFYLGEPFEALVRDQVEFLTRQLQPATNAPPRSP